MRATYLKVLDSLFLTNLVDNLWIELPHKLFCLCGSNLQLAESHQVRWVQLPIKGQVIIISVCICLKWSVLNLWRMLVIDQFFDHFGGEVVGGMVLHESLFLFVENNEMDVDSAKFGQLHGLLDKPLLSLGKGDVPWVCVLDVVHRFELSSSHLMFFYNPYLL